LPEFSIAMALLDFLTTKEEELGAVLRLALSPGLVDWTVIQAHKYEGQISTYGTESGPKRMIYAYYSPRKCAIDTIRVKTR
jgi:hypothetical protein